MQQILDRDYKYVYITQGVSNCISVLRRERQSERKFIMSKQELILAKQFNPYDSYEVAQIKEIIKLRRIQRLYSVNPNNPDNIVKENQRGFFYSKDKEEK